MVVIELLLAGRRPQLQAARRLSSAVGSQRERQRAAACESAPDLEHDRVETIASSLALAISREMHL